MNITIERVVLDNIKSYAGETSVDLGEGVTAILGDNGAGKSTIQEGVGYALFDTHPFDRQSRLVREGESSGSVAVTFRTGVPDDDGDDAGRYTVKRWAGRSKYEVYEGGLGGGRLPLETKSEVLTWLCQQFGVDDPGDLSEVWERSVGVPQTNFLSDFVQTEATRVDTFDPLFDIERYRDAYKSLSGLGAEFEAEISETRDEITRLDERLDDLPEVRENVDQYEAAVDRLGQEIDNLTSEIAERADEKSELEQIQSDLESARNRLETLEQTTIPNQEQRVEAAEDARDEAQKASDRLDDLRSEHEEYVRAQNRLEDLRERKDERAELNESVQSLSAKIDSCRNEVERLRDERQDAEDAAERLETLREKRARYRELDERIDELEDDERRIEEIDSRIEEIETEIDEREQERERLTEEIAAAEDRRETAAQLDSLRDRRQELVARRQSLDDEIEELETQNEELRALDLGETAGVDCPTCDREITARHRETVIEHNEDRLTEIRDTERPEVVSEIETVDDEITRAEEASEAVDEIPDLEQARQEAEETVETLDTDREELRDERRELESRVADLPDLRAEHEELSGVEATFGRVEARAEKVDELRTELQAARDELGAALVDYDETQAALTEYDGLDEQIADAKQTVTETEAAHEEFLRRKETAETLPDRRETLENERETLTELREEADEVGTEVDDLEAEFDAERLDTLETEIEQKRTKKSKKEGKRDTRTDDLEEAREELADLEAKQERRAELEAEVAELERDKEFAEWARKSLQRGADDLRDLITTEVGDRANEIFQQLRGNPTERLVWDKTYELRVRVAGQDKPFDGLSGGEKMAAALSVRLAILEQLASVGIAFLDEPTANLDRQKRANLVDQLRDLDGLAQLFVVSHDRTFESMTERVVELEKDETTEATEVVSD